MRRLIVTVLSIVLGIGIWAGGELVAFAATPHEQGRALSATPLCQPTIAKRAMAGRKVGLTLQQAHSCWPNATPSSTGEMPTPGEYLIPHAGGWIHAGWKITSVVNNRDTLAYTCGERLAWAVQSWEQWLANIAFTSGDAVSICWNAWSDWQTPACSGMGRCLPPVFGVLGQHTQTVNPWYNQTVDYFALTEFFYCRHFVSAQGAISAYCG